MAPLRFANNISQKAGKIVPKTVRKPTPHLRSLDFLVQNQLSAIERNNGKAQPGQGPIMPTLPQLGGNPTSLPLHMPRLRPAAEKNDSQLHL